MSEDSAALRRMVAELRFGSDLAGVAQVGKRSIHQYWHLLAAHFRDILLAPQRRFDEAGVAWTWRETASSRPANATELATLRKRLASCNESFGESAERELGRPSPGTEKTGNVLGEVRAAMSGIVLSLNSKSDPDLTAFVARTEMGLMLHSWGASVPARPASPEVHEYEVSGRVIVGVEPGAGYEVALENRKGLRMSWMITDASGCFGFPAIGSGEYRLRVISDRAHFPAEGTPIKVERSALKNLELRSSDSPNQAPEPSVPAAEEIAVNEGDLPSNHSRTQKRFVLLGLLLILGLVGGRCAWKANSRSKQTASLSEKTAVRESEKTLQANSSTAPLARSFRPANGSAAALNPPTASAKSAGPPSRDASAKFADSASDPSDAKNPKPDLSGSIGKTGDSRNARIPETGPNADHTGTASPESDAAESEFTSKTGALSLATPGGGAASALAGDAAGGLPANGAGGVSATPSAEGANASTAAANSPSGAGISADKKNSAKPNSGSGAKPGGGAAASAGSNPVVPANSSVEANPDSKPNADSPQSNPSVPTGPPPASPSPKSIADEAKLAGKPDADALDTPAEPATKEIPSPQPATPPRPPSRKKTSGAATAAQAGPEEKSPSPESSSDAPTSTGEKNETATANAESAKDSSKVVPPASSTSTNSASNGSEAEADSNSSAASEKRALSRVPKKSALAPNQKNRGDSPPSDASPVTDKQLPESDSTIETSSLKEKGRNRFTVQTSAWELRLLGDLIIPTRPMRADEEDAFEALRAQLLKERRAQIPAALAHPNTWCGYALELPTLSTDQSDSSLPRWRRLQGGLELETTVRANRAEIAWPSEKTVSSTIYILSDTQGQTIARFTIDSSGAVSLTYEKNIRSWLWIGVEGTSPDSNGSGIKPPASRFEWQCLQGAVNTAVWRRDDQWRNGKGFRLDLASPEQNVEGGRLTLAFVDRLSGWALVRDLAQTTKHEEGEHVPSRSPSDKIQP